MAKEIIIDNIQVVFKSESSHFVSDINLFSLKNIILKYYSSIFPDENLEIVEFDVNINGKPRAWN